MKSAANPSSWNRRSSSPFSRSRVISSSAPKGSSKRKTLGSSTSERASEARIFMPPESCLGYLSSKPFRPTSSTVDSTSLARAALSMPWSSASSSMFLPTVRHGRSVASWKT